MRGRKNEPAFVVHTADFLAELRNTPRERFERVTTDNFFRLFSKAARPADMMRVTILGCGGSGGVPTVGNHWGDCDPTNPKNARRRVSVLVQGAGQTVLVDTSPDLRSQLLDAKVGHLDAVLYTHDHADHMHGIDDLRFLRRDRGMPPISMLWNARDAGLDHLAIFFCIQPRHGRLGRIVQALCRGHRDRWSIRHQRAFRYAISAGSWPRHMVHRLPHRPHGLFDGCRRLTRRKLAGACGSGPLDRRCAEMGTAPDPHAF